MGHFNYKSLSKSLKCELWHLWAISFTIPYPNHRNMTYGSYVWAIPITIPYQNHWNMTHDSYVQFSVNSLSKSFKIWPVAAMGNFHYNSLPKPLNYDLGQLRAISFTIPYENHWNMTYGSDGPFPLQFLIKIIAYDLWQLWAISITIPYQNHWNMIYGSYGPFPL